MEKTWTVVKFKDENVVEAVPTTWINNGKCYWPSYTADKMLKAIKDHDDPDFSWTSYKVYVFKDSTFGNYQESRLKAKKAEDTSDLNSDNDGKRKIKKKLFESESELNSSASDNEDDWMLPSPPDLKEYSDTENQTSNMSYDSFNNNISDMNNRKQKSVAMTSCNKENHDSLKMCKTNKDKKIVREKTDDSSTNVSTPLNRNVYTSNVHQRYSQKEKECSTTGKVNTRVGENHAQKDRNMHRYNASNADEWTDNANYGINVNEQTDNINLCTCCPIHNIYNEEFKRVFKELFFLRELTKECCKDIKATVLSLEIANKSDEIASIFINNFQFPLRHLEELNKVEGYLEEPNHFQSAVQELSKMGGNTAYDFVKRCLSLLLSNRFAEQYSWHGAKKKQIFGKLFLANVLQESALLCKAAKNKKEVEEAIKRWLRRAKERADKEEK